MRYTRMREWLSRMNRDERRGRDSRNPYGSRGGYVMSDRRNRGYDMRGENYGYDRMGDMARNREYAGSNRDRNYSQSEYEMASGDHEYGRQSNRDYARRVGYFDYNDDYNNYYMNQDYGYDMARRRDYSEENYKLTPSEIRKWEKELKKEGANFSVDQVKQIAQQHGMHFEEYTPELLTVIANAMYTDYKDSVKGDITTYVKMAKDFLEDDDFDGSPEEKAYLYYTAIVCKEDED